MSMSAIIIMISHVRFCSKSIKTLIKVPPMVYESYLVVNMLLESIEIYVVGQIIEKGRGR